MGQDFADLLCDVSDKLLSVAAGDYLDLTYLACTPFDFLRCLHGNLCVHSFLFLDVLLLFQCFSGILETQSWDLGLAYCVISGHDSCCLLCEGAIMEAQFQLEVTGFRWSRQDPYSCVSSLNIFWDLKMLIFNQHSRSV